MNEQGLSKGKARKEADELFLSRERKQLIKEYDKLLTRMYAIMHSPLHRKITEEIQNIMEKYGYTFGRASSIVL